MIYLAADHGGYQTKEELKAYLNELDFEFEDLGAADLNPNDDYVDFAAKVAKKVAENPEESKGVMICRSGIGMDIVANKFKGVRSAQVFNSEMAKKSREHNDANVLSLAADYIDKEIIREIVKVWLETEFSGEERHVRRLDKIKEIESA